MKYNIYKNILNISIKGVVKIDKNRVDLALYVINLKIANFISTNQEKDYMIFKEKLLILTKEKDEIYKGNEEVIEKVLNVYLEEIKERG